MRLVDGAWKIGLLAATIGNIYFSSRYVGKEDFQKQSDKLDNVKEQVVIIRENMKASERMDRELAEVKTKLSTMENDSVIRESRILQLEKLMLPKAR